MFENIVGSNSKSKNFFIIASEKGFAALSAIISLSLVARYFGTENLGNYVLALSTVTSFLSIYTLNLNSMGLRDLSKNNICEKKIITTIFLMRFFACIPCIFLINLVAYFFFGDAFFLIFIISLSLIFNPLECFEIFLQSKERFFPIALIRIGSLMLSLLMQIFIVFTGKSFIFVIYVILLERCLVGILYLLFFKNFRKLLVLNLFSRDLSRIYLSQSWKEIFSGLFVILILRSGLFYVGYQGTDKEKAIFGTAIRVFDAILAFMQAYAKVILPEFFRTHFIDYNKSIEIFKKQVGSLTFASFLIIILSNISSNYFFILLFGPDFEESALIFNILVFSTIFFSFEIMSANLNIADNKVFHNALRSFIGALACFVIIPFIYEIYDLQGLAFCLIFSTLLSYFIYTFFRLDSQKIAMIKLKSLLTFGIIYLRK